MTIEEKKFFRADLDDVEAFMGIIAALRDPDFRGRFMDGEELDECPTEGKLAPLVEFLRGQPEEQLAFHADLTREDGALAAAEMYDEYNPRLYYL